MHKSLIKGMIGVFIINILAAGLAYLIRIVLARNLMVSEYGLLFSLFALISFATMFVNFGMGDAIVKYVPAARAKGDFEGAKKVIITAFIIQTLIFIIISALIIVFSKLLAQDYFKVPIARYALLLFIPFMFFDGIKALVRSSYQSLQKIKVFIIIYFFENLLMLTALLLFIPLCPNIMTVIGLYVLAYSILSITFAKMLMNNFSDKKVIIKKEDFSNLIRFGLPVLLGSIGGVVMIYIDTIMLTAYRTLEEVGIYNVVVPTAMMMLFLAKSVCSVIQPKISEWQSKGDKKEIIFSLRKIERTLLIMMIPLSIIGIIFSEIAINILFGPAYSTGANTLRILIIAMIPLVIFTVHSTYLTALGKPIIPTKILLVAAVINVVINLYAIPKLGIIGAGIASLTSYTIAAIMSYKGIRRMIR